MSTDWHAEAREALPILIRCARRGETITYGELGEQIGVHHRQVGRILGIIRDEICRRGERAPMLNVLVVRKDQGVPGTEVLAERSRYLPEDKLEAKVAEHQHDVFSYDGWDEFLAEQGLKPVE
ncbi:MAG: hypothetical protein GX131_15185 [candidate division WS1 bacterium]|jgi:alkylated DNA nucleotide flippase Atl1|nr:hypothetical protein [candidate division WS1 bacterium]